jgi:DNA-binding response OmpR family regulator
MKLLVVDDSPEIVEILSLFMEMSGYGVDGAHDGIEAVECLQHNSYDVVITDADMPRMNGIEVCKFLKEQFPGVYVIGMSGCYHTLNELKNAGADVCFSKPFNISEIEEVIENRFSPSLHTFDSAQSYYNSGLL